MPNVVLTRHVLAVCDLSKATRYFLDVLGFEREGIAAEGWSFLFLGDFRVMIGECPDEVSAQETGNHSYFAYVLVEDIDGYYTEIRDRGAEFSFQVKDRPWGLREFCVLTPEGHRIVFGQEIEEESE